MLYKNLAPVAVRLTELLSLIKMLML